MCFCFVFIIMDGWRKQYVTTTPTKSLVYTHPWTQRLQIEISFKYIRNQSPINSIMVHPVICDKLKVSPDTYVSLIKL